MAKEEDVRWQQRLENFKKALGHALRVAALEQIDMDDEVLLIKYFEMSSELGWKLLKDILESEGHSDLASPAKAIRQAYQTNLIPDGRTWMDALSGRNSSVHVYNEDEALNLATEIRHIYLPALIQLRDEFDHRIRR